VNPAPTLIILAWNNWDLTKRCLETLRETDIDGSQVIVVDNGSTDETSDRLAELDWIRVLTLPENVGFVRGNNHGIEAAGPDADIVLLNNDLEFEQKDWLRRLRECAYSQPDVGIVGCRLRLPDGRLLHAGTYILPDTMWGQQQGSLEKDIGQFSARREVEGIVFAVAYLRREVIDSIGGLALDFESYFEDTDYCFRAKEAGFKTLVCGDVTLIHDEHGSTALDAVHFSELFQASRKTFTHKWKHVLEKRYSNDVFWQSIMNFPSGYARCTRSFLPALERQGVRTTYRYVYGLGSPFEVEEPDNSGDYLLNVIRGRRQSSKPKASVVFGQGDVFNRNSGRYKIGYTMLEVDGFPSDWVQQANRLNEIWVPSEFNRQGFLRCGLKRPIHLMPLGVNTNYFHPDITSHTNPLGEFIFLANFEWGERKEPWMLLRAFSETFRADEPVRLLCKIINRDPNVAVKTEISLLDLKDSGGKISFLFNLEFPHYQLGSLYRSADCLVSPTRGEGWDMPLMEAMACGLPCIATDWGAHKEFVHDGIAYPLAIKGTSPARAKCPYYDGFSWANPDEDHLRYLLRYVYEHQEEAAAVGQAAASEMAAKWTWDHAARRIADRLAAIDS